MPEGCVGHRAAENVAYDTMEDVAIHTMADSALGCSPHCPIHGKCTADLAVYDAMADSALGCSPHCPVADQCPADYAVYHALADSALDPCPQHNASDWTGVQGTDYQAAYAKDFGEHLGGDLQTHYTEERSAYESSEDPKTCGAVKLPGVPEFEPYPGEYPTLTIPTYEEYAGQFPQGQLPTYEEYTKQFPELTVERYEEYGREYPGLGDMYELSEAGIRQLMATTGLPVDELMKAYTAEEKAFLDERLPEIREQWSSVGLMRSGMTAAQELKEVGVSARKMATTRAELEKESVIFQQQGLQTGIQLAMQHAGMGYEAATDAFRSGQQEYQKAHDSAVEAGASEYEARVQGYNAQIDEYVKKFVSSVEAERFVQGIEERAFDAARQEYQKVFDSQVAKGLTEFEAQQAAYEAGQSEYARIQDLEFNTWQTEYIEEMKRYLMELGFSTEEAIAAAQGWGNIFGTVIGLLLQWLLGLGT